MEFTTEVYEKYNRMVYKKVHQVSTQFSIPTEELEGFAMERFCLAVERYTPQRGSFSTCLHWYLRALEEFAAKQYRIVSIEGDLDTVDASIFEDSVLAAEEDIRKIELYDSISRELSTDSQCLLKDIFEGLFEKPISSKGGCPRKFPVGIIKEKYGWDTGRIKAVRNEITEWWGRY